MPKGLVKIVLFPGLLGIGKRVTPKKIAIRPESLELAKTRSSEGYVRGVAMEKDHRLMVMEFGKPGALNTHLGVVWAVGKEMCIVHFAKCYFNEISSWQLAALSQVFREFFSYKGEEPVRVYNVEPLILGGKWEDVSQNAMTRESSWVKFQPFLKKPRYPDTVRVEKISEISNEVLGYLRSSDVSEDFIEELISLREKRINGLSEDFAKRKGA